MFVKNTRHVRRINSRCESLASCRAPQMEEGGGATPGGEGVGGLGAAGVADPVADDAGGHVGHLLVRIHVPELNVQKCLQFPRDQLVWDVKQQCLAALPKPNCFIL
ncbi:unnamed protein product [Acanthoscelides obtectus]|uniref:Talin N-terminal F0 domain-containing protein n=1 Tax=Acanthoscelides obtectus TaxID=200917 RepID=A0A9P0PAE6_ACAOB|nr:unnamed protein product [Acanthoscelides obtectus]CAK1645773.1 hypothetical protein AOBTE_LOCUS14260 [Acanthoscelides obtectus]